MTYPETIAGCCRELLDASPEPLTLAELAAHAVAVGRTAARYPEMSVASTLRGNPHVVALDGDRFLSVPRLLEGRVLTTRPVEDTDPWTDSARPVDLAPFASLDDPPDGSDEDWATDLVAYRCVGGRVVAEKVHRDGLADGSELVAAVRGRLGTWQNLWPRELERQVLRACAEDDALLRHPVAPLSELFPELAPQPSTPEPRPCPACNGTGTDTDWERGWERSWPVPYDDEPAAGWQTRIERLEEVVFGL